MDKGALVISLDFELVWGVFDHIDLESYQFYFQNTLSIIPEMLECFVTNKVEVTWATVGMLFNDNWEEWMQNIPDDKPSYDNAKLDAYSYGLDYRNKGFDEFFFAPKLIRDITAAPGQEIATHTYSHYYCMEPGQTVGQFDQDLQLAVKMGHKVGSNVDSLVFPRNQLNEMYLNTCSKNGIKQVRSNPPVWFWNDPNNASLKEKLFRTGDAYLPLSSMVYTENDIIMGEITSQPASRFLRPHNSISILNNMRLQRIKNEMTIAAKKNKIYHLWWHPHNFGTFPKESMIALGEVIAHFKLLEDKYGMRSLNMQNL